MSIAIIDYGAGNVRSVELALKRLGRDSIVTADNDSIRNADRVIFPGVGHADSAMKALAEKELLELIPSLKQPVLGVCLGMQLLCRKTEEGDVDGLGIFEVDVVRFTAPDKVPHMGWNAVMPEESALLEDEEQFYFVHSYYVELCDWTTGHTGYFEPFSAMLEKDNFIGCQFHPEKSGKAGEQLIKRFLEL